MSNFSILRTLRSALEFMAEFVWPITALLIQASLLALATDIGLRHIFGWEAMSLLSAIFFAPVSVAIHRRIVLGEGLNPKHYLLQFGEGRVWRFIGWGFLASIIIGLIGLLGLGVAIVASIIFEGGALVLMGLGPTVFALAAVALLFRYAFIFPAIATDNFQSLRDARNLMRGLAFKVFVVIVLIGLAGVIVSALIEFTDSIIVELVLSVISVYLAALVPAALSIAYNEATSMHDHALI